MNALRRIYLFLAAAVSLQSAAWAAIRLLRQLVSPGFAADAEAISWPLAVLVIAVVIYLVHYLATERLLRESVDERRAMTRQLYLYGMSAGFLAPWLPNAVSLVAAAIAALTGQTTNQGEGAAALGFALRSNVPALVVLGLLWAFHWLTIRNDGEAEPPTTDGQALRRLYRLGFALAGWLMVLYSTIHVLRWVLLRLPLGSGAGVQGPEHLAQELARLAVGAGLWALAWRAAEGQRAGGNLNEVRSALRYLYLYAIVAIAVVATVVNGGLLLTGAFRRLLELPSVGDLRGPLPVIVVMGAAWALYSRLIAREVSAVDASPLQASVRRIYAYLVAAAGFGSVLVGTSVFLSVVLRAVFGMGWETPDKEKLTWSAAAMLVGLAVWAPAWRSAQAAASEPTPEGSQERSAFSRKLYAYVALFVTVMMTMWAGVDLLRKIIVQVLGGQSLPWDRADLLQAAAVLAVGAAGWAYHALVLRDDGRRDSDWKAGREAALATLVIDGGDGSFGKAVLDALRHELPALALIPLGLTAEARAAMGQDAGPEPPAGGGDQALVIPPAGLIVGSWEIVRPGGLGGAVSEALASTIDRHAAQKLLVPTASSGTSWSGVDPQTPDGLVDQTVVAVRQIVAGEPVHAVRPLLMPGALVTGFLVFVLLIVSWVILVSGIQAFVD